MRKNIKQLAQISKDCFTSTRQAEPTLRQSSIYVNNIQEIAFQPNTEQFKYFYKLKNRNDNNLVLALKEKEQMQDIKDQIEQVGYQNMITYLQTYPTQHFKLTSTENLEQTSNLVRLTLNPFQHQDIQQRDEEKDFQYKIKNISSFDYNSFLELKNKKKNILNIGHVDIIGTLNQNLTEDGEMLTLVDNHEDMFAGISEICLSETPEKVQLKFEDFEKYIQENKLEQFDLVVINGNKINKVQEILDLVLEKNLIKNNGLMYMENVESQNNHFDGINSLKVKSFNNEQQIMDAQLVEQVKDSILISKVY